MGTTAIDKLALLRKGPVQGNSWRVAYTKQLDELLTGFSITGKELTVFTRLLATMVQAELPILKCLETINDQVTNKRFKQILSDICQDVRNGCSLSEALEKKKSLFGDFMVSMTEVGETSGQLGPILERVAAYMEKANNLKRKLKTAMAYPFLIVLVAIGSIVFLMTTIIPTFASLFAGFEATLPAPTRFVLAASNLIKEHFVVLFMVIVLLVVAVIYAYRKTKLHYWVDDISLRMPLFGMTVRKNVIARFSRSLGTLLGNGVSIMDALTITSRTVGNLVVEKVVLQMRDNIQSGHLLVEPMVKSGVFTPMIIQMVRVGEETGKMGEMLSRVAEFYEGEVDAAIEVLTAIIEPVIIIILGVILGGILIAMYLPMFELINIIQ
jgi:type IV pilus assembly protein PilC